MEQAPAEYTLEWRDLRVESIHKGSHVDLLKGVSGFVSSGQLLLIMGPSGAGKTTLLNILAGKDTEKIRIDGEILCNGFARTDFKWARMHGYVEQFDILHEFLTPREALYFMARFKNVKPSSAERYALIDDLLKKLSISHLKNKRVSSGFSGGERKRVAIALEFVSDPRFLFLDEPTSGLDAFNSVQLLRILREMATGFKKCIILTAHQPRHEIFDLVDTFLLLAQGKTVYFGSAVGAQSYFAALGYHVPPNTNPPDFFIDLVTKDTRSPELEQESLQTIFNLIDAWQRRETEIPIRAGASMAFLSNPQCKKANFFVQTLLLTRRELLNTGRNSKFQISRIIQICAYIVVLGLAFLQIGLTQRDVQNRIGVLFFITINVLFTTLNPFLNLFPEDRARITKERQTDAYSGCAAYAAKLISAWPTLFALNVVYLSALYWIIGLQASARLFFTFLLILLLVVLLAQALALAIGAASRDLQVAHVAAPTILILFVIFGGNFANPLTLKPYLVWLYWMSPVQFGYKALAQNEFVGLSFSCEPAVSRCFLTGYDVLSFYYLYYPGKWTCILILMGLVFFIQMLGMLILNSSTRTVLSK